MLNRASDPIESLAIGNIIEVDGTHFVAQLTERSRSCTKYSRSKIYPIGQFGSIIKVHFGRVVLYGYVGRLRMKAEYELKRRVVTAPDEDVEIS